MDTPEEPVAAATAAPSTIPIANNDQHQDQQYEQLIWSPEVVEGLDQVDLNLYVQFASTPCIPGGGCDIEEALEVLYNVRGSIPLAMQQLLVGNYKEKEEKNNVKHLNSNYQTSNIWTMNEVENFERLKMLHGKDFYLISQLLGTKTRHEVVQFYYKWKKSTLLRNHRSQGSPHAMSSIHSLASSSYTTTNCSVSSTSPQLILDRPISTTSPTTPTTNNLSLLASVLAVTPSTSTSSSSSSSTSDESRDSGRGDELMMSLDEHNLQYQQHLHSLQQQQQQLQHRQSVLLLPPLLPPPPPPQAQQVPQSETFPCKVCGRVFEKVKSRSAHMKRHKNERLYNGNK